jgi:hypothetical protein
MVLEQLMVVQKIRKFLVLSKLKTTSSQEEIPQLNYYPETLTSLSHPTNIQLSL